MFLHNLLLLSALRLPVRLVNRPILFICFPLRVRIPWLSAACIFFSERAPFCHRSHHGVNASAGRLYSPFGHCQRRGETADSRTAGTLDPRVQFGSPSEIWQAMSDLCTVPRLPVIVRSHGSTTASHPRACYPLHRTGGDSITFESRGSQAADIVQRHLDLCSIAQGFDNQSVAQTSCDDAVS